MLASAARQFHSAASSTSGSVRIGTTIGPWQNPSLLGDFSEQKRRRVQEFVEAAQHDLPDSVKTGYETPVERMTERSTHTLDVHVEPSLIAPNTSFTADSLLSDESNDEKDPEDDEADDEREYFDGLQELARDRIVNGDYTKAIDFLTEAMKQAATICGSDVRQLQVLLVICHFFQGNWRQAKPIVAEVVALVLDEVACNLLHALSLAYLSEYSLDNALKMCQQALSGKRKLLKMSGTVHEHQLEDDYAETLGLRATIHHMQGDPIRAEIYHRRLPVDFEYKHPDNELDFIVKHPRLLPNILHEVIPNTWPVACGRPTLDTVRGKQGYGQGPTQAALQTAMALRRNGAMAESPLRLRFAHFERYEEDTQKILSDKPLGNSLDDSPACSPADSAIDISADALVSTPLDVTTQTPVTQRSDHPNSSHSIGSSLQESSVPFLQNEVPLIAVPSPRRLRLARRATRVFTRSPQRTRNVVQGPNAHTKSKDMEPSSSGHSSAALEQECPTTTSPLRKNIAAIKRTGALARLKIIELTLRKAMARTRNNVDGGDSSPSDTRRVSCHHPQQDRLAEDSNERAIFAPGSFAPDQSEPSALNSGDYYNPASFNRPKASAYGPDDIRAACELPENAYICELPDSQIRTISLSLERSSSLRMHLNAEKQLPPTNDRLNASTVDQDAAQRLDRIAPYFDEGNEPRLASPLQMSPVDFGEITKFSSDGVNDPFTVAPVPGSTAAVSSHLDHRDDGRQTNFGKSCVRPLQVETSVGQSVPHVPLDQVARVLGSLSEWTTTKAGRREAKLELEDLLKRLNQCSNDRVLISDMERILASLGDDRLKVKDTKTQKKKRSDRTRQAFVPDIEEWLLGTEDSNSSLDLHPESAYEDDDGDIAVQQHPEDSMSSYDDVSPVSPAPSGRFLQALPPERKSNAKGQGIYSNAEWSFSFVVGDDGCFSSDNNQKIINKEYNDGHAGV